MPTYGYRCPTCGAEFDVVQRMSDPAEASCPECGAAGKRLFFPVGITFKGQGFYKTDSRSSSNGSNGTSGDAAPDTKKSTDTTSAPAASPPPSSSSSSTSTSTASAT